ncbi:MAG: hypothetical protein AAF962_17025 [Actinomycetota bacterium]
MSNASAEAKQQIILQLRLATLKFKDLPVAFGALHATGKSVNNMAAAVEDLSANVEQLETALNDAFDELDREIVSWGRGAGRGAAVRTAVRDRR